ncbi:DUF3352 domain-containing protein [Tessaracoccus sp. OS52]|uniref:DUF3352 domain-containing protein n=1 Tax=Tessaracoccus sp. OS52 TaxID=2886691 RepID=UPI001D0F4BD6|nr:DUF3352 domain-containing protein [Tessaracoccus sp. OS52]
MSENQRPGNGPYLPQGPEGSFQQPQGQPHPHQQQQDPHQQYAHQAYQQGYRPNPQQQYAQQQFQGYPQQFQGYPHQAEVPVRKSKTPLIVAAVVALALVAGGGFLAVSLLRGSTPVAANGLPGDALAVIELNLNPSAADKLAVKDFASKFPDLAGDVTDVGDDYKLALWNLIPDDQDKPDYDTQIKPWLGDSAALALTGDVQTPDYVVAVQVTDTEAARSFAESELQDSAVGFIDELMIISERDTPADIDAIKASPVADNEEYKADMAKLGGGYLATGWMSEGLVQAAMDQSETDTGIQTADLSVHGAAGLRIEDGTAVMRAVSWSSQSAGDSELDAEFVRSLPAAGLGALGYAFSDEAVNLLWEQLAPTLRESPEMGSMFGVESEEDLRTLLGSQFAASVGWEGSEPRVGIKVKTDDPAGHQQIMQTLAQALGVPGVQHSTDGNTVYTTYGMRPEELSNPSERLGDKEEFDELTASTGDAQTAVWVDLPAILASESLGLSGSPQAQSLAPISGVGMSGGTVGDGYTEIFLRVGTR